jgi:hypothetical protein
MTPFKAWHGRKPDVSFLAHVWVRRTCEGNKAGPRQAGGQEHTDGVPGV